MRTRLTHLYCLSALIILWMTVFTPPAHSACDQPDAPDCTCFVDTSTWDAGGPSYPGTVTIQNVASDVADDPATATRDEVVESCNCPGTLGCTWDPDPLTDRDFGNAGKPYYQFTLGQNTRSGALWLAELMATTDIEFHGRTEWCSETISYWHREAGIPYFYGYRNDWHEDWMVDTVLDLRFWYAVEEYLGGRGRWINSDLLDYTDFQPGVNAPLPGAYVAIAQFRYGPPASWGDESGNHTYSHSLLVNEMTVHRDLLGNVYQVEISLLEGNSRKKVRNDRVWTDILSLTPQGSGWVSTDAGPDGISGNADDINRKIYGFGIDLDEHGNPIYDATRLHEVTDPVIVLPRSMMSMSAADAGWKQTGTLMGALVAYASDLRKSGGPTIALAGGQARPLPDGQAQMELHLDSGFTGTVLIDLKGAHPLPIEGVELLWGPGFLPKNYSVEFIPGNQQSSTAKVPHLASIVPPPGESTPVPIRPDKPLHGVQIVRLVFPSGSIQAKAVLRAVRFFYSSASWGDAPGESVPVELPVFVDVKPSSCPNSFNPEKDGVVPVAILGSGSFDVKRIDPTSVKIGGVSPVGWAYEDVATPFIGPPAECHEKGKDGKMDLLLKFNARALDADLGLTAGAGSLKPLTLKGRLKAEYGLTPVHGQDWIKVRASLPWLMLLLGK